MLGSRSEPHSFGEPSYWEARIHAEAGDVQEALVALEEAVAEGSMLRPHFHMDPGLSALGGEPRFEALIRSEAARN